MRINHVGTNLNRTLVGKWPSCPELAIMMLGKPQMVTGICHTFGHNTVRMCQCELCRRRHQFISHRSSTDGIVLILVHNLENPAVLWSCICKTRCLHNSLSHFVPVAIRVYFRAKGQGVRLLLNDCVLVPVNCRINTNAEKMLVVLR